MGIPGGERVFRSRRVVTADGVIEGAVHVADGRVQRVTPASRIPSSTEIIELGDLALLPGFVDTHVHVNEPGRADWEGFESATRAAAAGGVTTLVDMPLNSVPPTTTAAGLRDKLHAASGRLSVDVAFWGGVVPGNTGELGAMHAAGVVGFKCFLAPSGVSEFEHVTYEEMEKAMGVLAALEAPLLVHGEDPGVLERSAATVERFSCTAYASTRPAAAELEAVRRVLQAAERTGVRVHIVHVSAAQTLHEIAAARDRGVQVTAETCPHYLWFAAEEVPAGGVQWKCAPPIRDDHNRRQLREALRRGLIDLVVSDHSPCPPQLKDAAGGDFLAAWGGISSLQIAPLVTWTVAASEGCSLAELSEWTAAAPARLAGLAGSKGAIVEGRDADFAVLDSDAETVVDARRLHHRHRLTPYDGAALRGRVIQTWLRGELVYDDGVFSAPAHGRAMLRGRE